MLQLTKQNKTKKFNVCTYTHTYIWNKKIYNNHYLDIPVCMGDLYVWVNTCG